MRNSAIKTPLRGDAKITRRGIARREALLRAAAEEFLAHGYERATIANINRRAGGSTTTIYREFGGKAGLFTEVMTQERQLLNKTLDSHDLGDKPISEGLVIFAQIYVSTMLSPRVAALHRLVVAEANRFPEIRNPLLVGYELVTDKLTAYIRERVDRDGLSIRSPREAAMLFVALLRGQFFPASLLFDGRAVSGEVAEFIGLAVRFFETAYRIRD